MLLGRLALRFGRTIDELLDTMTASEFYHWKVRDLFDPIGDVRFDVLAKFLFAAVGGDPNHFPKWDSWIDDCLPVEDQIRSVMAKLMADPKFAPTAEPKNPGPVVTTRKRQSPPGEPTL